MAKQNLNYVGTFQCNIWVNGPGQGRSDPHFEQRYVTVWIDPYGLAEEYGHRAIRNKSGKCKLAHGHIVVERKEK